MDLSLLGKLFTCMSLSPSSIIWYQSRAVMPCGWESNHRSSIALVLHALLIGGQVSCTKETFQDLSLPIPGKEQLQYIRASSQQLATSASSCDSPLLTAAGQRNPCAETGWKLAWLSSMFSWMFRFSHQCLFTFVPSVL